MGGMRVSSQTVLVKKRTASNAKYGFLILALIFIAVLVGYGFAFVKIGPADKIQAIAYVALFTVTSGLLLVSLVAFLIVLLGFGACRVIPGVYISLVLLLLGSLVSSAVFNWAPTVKSTSKYLRESLYRTGKPSPYIQYIQRYGHCCGAYGLSDYKMSKDSYFPIPASCCNSKSCTKNASLAPPGCLLQVPGWRKFVYAKNSPTLRHQILSIELCPMLLSFFTSATILLFSYFHCWRMVFHASVPKVVVIVSNISIPEQKSRNDEAIVDDLLLTMREVPPSSPPPPLTEDASV